VSLLLTAVLVLTGCGGDDPEPSDKGADTSGSDDSGDSGDSGDDQFDACGLLEPADLEAAFGSPFEDGEAVHLDQTGGDQCLWVNTDPPPIKQFSVVVMRDGHLSEAFEDAGVTVESLFEDTKAYMDAPEDVDLGDSAYLAGSTLAVLDGDTSYEFSTVLGTSPEAIAGLRTLAEKALG
jgi:hypothetical protein